jgi:hypothetical protein
MELNEKQEKQIQNISKNFDIKSDRIRNEYIKLYVKTEEEKSNFGLYHMYIYETIKNLETEK